MLSVKVHPLRAGLNLAIFGLWLWLYGPVFGYLALIFSREDFRANQIVLLAVLLLLAFQIRRGQFRPRFDLPPRLHRPALGLVLGGSLLYLLVERFLDINTLSASLFGLASYGLLGLWLPPRPWRQGLPAALLIIGTLPFGEHLQTFVGYPMRLLTAAIVRDGLAAAGLGSIGVDTILVFENGVSQVDLPCSGVRSLWSGALFLLAATWVERRPLNLRWLLVALVFAGLLFGANLARVAVLAGVGPAAGWELAAEMLHLPLGVLGFVAACAAAVGLLRRQPPIAPTPAAESELQPVDSGRATSAPGEAATLYEPEPEQRRLHPGSSVRPPGALRDASSPVWLAPALLLTLVLMGLIYAPRPQTGLAQPPPTWDFSDDLVTEPAPLKPDEVAWLTRDGAESADRRRFRWRSSAKAEISGTMILITSRTWRAHHRPERCFEVYGLSIDDSHTYLVNPDFPLRVVSLGDDQRRGLYSASYWFQTAGRVTDDYGSRIWADLAARPERWVLVSILFDDVYDAQSADLQPLYLALRAAVARGLAAQQVDKF
jgi:exosortase/archaeosortase family protein